MNRRDFLNATAASALLTSTRWSWGRNGEALNLLVIHTDEHHFRTLGCYRALEPEARRFTWGELTCDTPHIDRLAAEGAICTRFYATTPVCSPSRAAFVTGQYPHTTPVNTNNIPMADDVVTFAELLRRRGYRTGYAGKWHLDGNGKPQWKPERHFGFEDNRFMFNRGHWKQFEDAPDGPRVKARNAKGKPSYDVKGADGTSFATDWLAAKTIDFIEAAPEAPFCYMVSIPDPHGPNSVRPPYDTMYDPEELQPPAIFDAEGAGLPKWAALPAKRRFAKAGMARYYGMVKCIDDNVGRIVAALRRHDILDRTVVIFTADHGDLCGEHGRHNKGNAFEGSARIPFIIRYPGRITPGKVVPQALSCVDVLPTILALLGCPTAGREHGRDASALFTGEAPADWNDVAFMRSTGDPGRWIAAVSGRCKLVLALKDRPCLFDLDADPDEQVNRFLDPTCRDTVRALARELKRYCTTFNEPLAADAGITHDLEWAANGTGAYTPPA